MDNVGKEDPRPPRPILKLNPGSVKVVRAISKHNARYPGELSFDEGDVLYIFGEANDEWWKGRCKNETGLIRSNYVVSRIEEIKEPLHDAAKSGNLTFLKECLGQGVSPTGLDSMGNTPLSWASLTNHTDCAKSLLKYSAIAVNVQNKNGETPLHLAAANNHLGIVELLLHYGADPDIKNKNGDIPEKLASDPAVKNLLKKHLLDMNSKTYHSSFNPKQYGD